MYYRVIFIFRKQGHNAIQWVLKQVMHRQFFSISDQRKVNKKCMKSELKDYVEFLRQQIICLRFVLAH